jgi:predicted amidohydrolase
MRIALVQLEVISGEVDTNRQRGLALAQEAAGKADIVVLPEIWTTGYGLRNIERDAEDEKGATITGLKKIAKSNGVVIVSGSIAFRRDAKMYNGVVVIDQTGEIIADYQKVHLFSMFNEERFFAPGDKRCVFEIGEAKAGVVICYDIRFPELLRAMAAGGVQIFFIPAEWPAARGAHWRLLNQTRAVENQVFVCAANCVGEHKGSLFYGHSMIVDPNGEILAEGSEREEIVYGEIDLAVLNRVRQNMTVWQDRRPEMYFHD